MRVAIIGAGIFGCVIGAALQREGCKITLFDCKRDRSGSSASGFLMKPSWFRKMQGSNKALELLDELYGLQELSFYTGTVETKVFRVHGPRVLHSPYLEIRDRKIKHLNDVHGYDTTIVAAGVWCNELIDTAVVGKVGISFSWLHKSLKRNFINPWAPFKQIVCFNVPSCDSVWGGDGSAILESNWSGQRERKCLRRVAKATKLDSKESYQHVGIRPYVKTDQPCYLQKVGEAMLRKYQIAAKNVWVATGGAKNGTIAAAWAANRLIERL